MSSSLTEPVTWLCHTISNQPAAHYAAKVHFGVSPGGWCRGHRAARGRLSSGDGSNRLPPALCPLLSDSFPFWNRAKVKQDTFIVLATGYLKVSQGDDEKYHLHLSEPERGYTGGLVDSQMHLVCLGQLAEGLELGCRWHHWIRTRAGTAANKTTRNLRFSQYCWGFRYSGRRRCAVWWWVLDVSSNVMPLSSW